MIWRMRTHSTAARTRPEAEPAAPSARLPVPTPLVTPRAESQHHQATWDEPTSILFITEKFYKVGNFKLIDASTVVMIVAVLFHSGDNVAFIK